MDEIQKANMMQIAEHCGVSLKTVSRVLNHPEQVSPKTREAVRRSMEQCGFQVNLLAKGLKQNRTNIIIVFLDKHNGDYMNLWRSRMLKYLFRYSSGIGLKIIVSPSDSHGFLEDETDGFYLLSSGIADGASDVRSAICRRRHYAHERFCLRCEKQRTAVLRGEGQPRAGVFPFALFEIGQREAVRGRHLLQRRVCRQEERLRL